MNISRLTKFAGAFFVLVLTVTTVFAQDWRNGNQVNNIQYFTCWEQITDLTKDQISMIKELENEHQKEIEQLRIQRRSATDLTEKDKIRTEMDKQVSMHRKNVKALLNEDQQKQYDQLHAFAKPNYARGRQAFARGGRGFNRGYGQRQAYCGAGYGRAERVATGYGRGYRQGAGRNAGYGRGYGRGHYNQPIPNSDSINSTEEN